MHTPYKTTRLPDTKHYTYLDVQGRPVVTIKNVGELTEKHIQDFQLEFVLPRYVCIVQTDSLGHRRGYEILSFRKEFNCEIASVGA